MNDKKITNYNILAIQANEDVGDITVSGSGLRSANVMRAADFIVDPKGPTLAAIRAIAEGPTRTVPVAMDTLPNGSYKAKFVPTEIGEIGRAHVWTPVTPISRMPSSAWKNKKKKRKNQSPTSKK